MADVFKVLAQSNPTAGTLTDVYTCASAGGAVPKLIVICNQAKTPTTYRVSYAVAGAADTVKQYLDYDVPLSATGQPGSTHRLEIGPLANTDVIRVYTPSSQVSVNVLGMEV